ncbi:MAG: YCF48-related protein [Ignavibacteriaceae bacterium]
MGIIITFHSKYYLIIISAFLFTKLLFPQNITITGNVSTSSGSVKYAQVTFMDVNDTAKSFSTLTDPAGNYRLNIILTSVNGNKLLPPSSFELEQNYPNPFLHSTSISYKLNTQTNVSITIYNILGQEIKRFSIPVQNAGLHSVIWDGTNNLYQKVSPGVYFYRLQNGKESLIKKMIYGTANMGAGLPAYINNNLPKSIGSYKQQSIINIEVKNLPETSPQVYDEVFEDTLKADTTLNFSIEAVGQWVKVNRGLMPGLKDIDFPDSSNGWVVGSLGSSDRIILYSDDSGESWQEQYVPVDDYLVAVDFIDNKNGWILGHHSILKTTNGGENWEVKYFNLEEGTFLDIQFLDNKIGFVAGGTGLSSILLKTTDGGENWQDMSPKETETFTHISIVDELNIWICGNAGTLLLSTDLGLTWSMKIVDPRPDDFTTAQFIDQNNGWVGANLIGFFKTTDGGNTWTDGFPDYSPGAGYRAIYFSDTLNGSAAPIFGYDTSAIISTGDGGKTWDFLPQGTRLVNVRAFCFYNNLRWAIGRETLNGQTKGVILRYK